MNKKTIEYTSYYRTYLNNLIINIRKEVPNNQEHILLRSELNNTLESLWYQAPEILDNTVIDVLHILTKYVPFYEDESKNPQWIKNIRTLWTVTVQELNNGLEIGVSIDKIDAPPLSDYGAG